MNKDGEEDFSFTRNLIASSSDEDEDEQKDEEEEGEEDAEEEDTISKYRSLLAGISQTSDKKNEKDLEVSWVPEEEKDEDEEKNLTPWEKYLKKKKDKKKNKLKKTTTEEEEEDEIPDDVDLEDPFFAEEMGLDITKKKKKKKENKNDKKKEVEEKEDKVTDLDLLVMDSDDEKNHFNYKTIVEEETMTKSKKKKWKNKKKDKADKGTKVEDNFDVNVEDDRFAAIFSRPEYNIDPSEQNFKKTKGMEKLIGEKQKRIQTGRVPVQEPKPKKSKLDPETSAAVKSLKNKWEKNAKRKKST